MIAQTKLRVVHLLKVEFVRFCVVGITGFVINFVILTLLHKGFNVPIFIAQLLGAEVALASNFTLHHHWTYRSHKVQKSLATLIVQFHASSWPAIVGSALMVTGCEKLLHFDNLLALGSSSLIALLWNFAWSKYVIWRKISTAEIERIAE